VGHPILCSGTIKEIELRDLDFRYTIEIMKTSQKLIGIVVLTAFALMAGSVVCLASGQPAVMSDCGSGMTTATMCPFMSASIPTIAAASFTKAAVTVLVLMLVFVAVAAYFEIVRRTSSTLSRYRRSPNRPPVSFLNATLRLISRGILHSRVFCF